MKDSSKIWDDALLYAKSYKNGIKLVQKAAERFLKTIDLETVWIDHRVLRNFEKFCNLIKHFKGEKSGESFKIEPWQAFIFANIYGIKLIVDGKKTNRFKYNYCYIEVPRKNGKSFMMSALALFDCFFGAPSGVEVYLTATKRDQSKIMFDNCLAFCRNSNGLAKMFKLTPSKSSITSRNSKGTNFIKALGADSDRLDGLNVYSSINDEIHAWKKRDLWDVIENSFGAREVWHMISITTAGNNLEGVCYQEHEHLIQLLNECATDSNKFGVIYAVDEAEKWQDKNQWILANPLLNCGKSMNYMENIYRKSKEIPSQINQFKNKQLNIWTESSECWIELDKWKSCIVKNIEKESLRGHECFIGFDLAMTNDLSAVAYFFPDYMHFYVDFYAPQERIYNRGKKDRIEYNQYAEQGFLTATPGNVTDFDFIVEDIKRNADRYHIDSITYDKYFAGPIITDLQREELITRPQGMNFSAISPACKQFERYLMEGSITVQDNPILNWCAGNVVVKTDPHGQIRPTKESDTNRIDGIVAIIIAIAGYEQSKNDREFKIRTLTLHEN